MHREGVTKACGNTRSSMMIGRADEHNGMRKKSKKREERKRYGYRIIGGLAFNEMKVKKIDREKL